MEPDEIIRNKIMQVEEAPVAWREEWVWSRVVAIKPTTKRPLFYMAASIAGILLSAGTVWVWHSQRSDNSNRIALLENRLSAFTTSASETQKWDECVDPPLPLLTQSPVVKEASAKTYSKTSIKNISMASTEAPEKFTTQSDETVEVPLPSFELNELDLKNAVATDEEQQKRVHAIFGPPIETTQVRVAKKQPRIRIRLLHPEEPHVYTEDDSSQPTNLIARINRN